MRTVNLNLVGLDGNVFSLLGAFSRQARRDGWTPEEVGHVVSEATSGDYDHALQTLMRYCEPQEDMGYEDEVCPECENNVMLPGDDMCYFCQQEENE